jgi:hypothetical protein
MSLAISIRQSTIQSSSTSKAANTVDTARASVLNSIRLQPMERAAVVGELYSLAAKQSPNPNWGAVPRAVEFLRALPTDVVLPEVNIDDDGEVALDWLHGGKMLTVTLESTGRVAYATDAGGNITSDEFEISDGMPGSLVATLQAFRAAT